MMVRHRLYGLLVESAYPLASSADDDPALGVGVADVTLRRGQSSDFSRVAKQMRRGVSGRTWFEHRRLPDGRDYLRWPALYEFLVSADGRRILGRQISHRVSDETFQTYLLSQLVSFSLLKLGMEPLHATAVVIHGKAVAFLGDCGEGKSTLAAACLKAGHQLLTDDVLVLKEDDSRLMAYPGPPRLKLMPATAKRVLGAHVNGSPMNPLTSKLILRLAPEQSVATPMPLHACYALRSSLARASSRVTIRCLSAVSAWRALTAGTFNLVVRDPTRLQTHFAWASRLASRAAVKSLSYPRSLRELPRVVDAIAADVGSS